MALSKIDTTNMIEDVPQSKLDNNINFRNIIINCDMSIAQRETAATTLALSSGGFRYNDVDRFAVNAGNVSSGQVSTQQIDSGLTGFPKAKRITVTTAQASPAADGYLSIIQNVEAQNLQYLKYGTSDALALTLSFYVRSSVTGNYAGNIIQIDNSARVFVFNFTINSANTWEKKTISILADASGSINNDNGIGFEVNFAYLYLGSNFNNGTLNAWNANSGTDEYGNSATRVNLLATSGATFDITGVQLEAGDTASDFEYLPKDVNLNRCMRYYQNSYRRNTTGSSTYPGDSTNSDIDGWYVTSWNDGNCPGVCYPVTMRTTPTITLRDRDNSTTGKVTNNNVQKDGSVITGNANKMSYVKVTSGVAATWVHYRWEADAEL